VKAHSSAEHEHADIPRQDCTDEDEPGEVGDEDDNDGVEVWQQRMGLI
jgi:hypothetical protein